MRFTQILSSFPSHLRAFAPRSKSQRNLSLAFIMCCVFLLLFISTSWDWKLATKLPSGIFRPSPIEKARTRCSPEVYSSGEWTRSPYWSRPGPLSKASPDGIANLTHIDDMARKEDALMFSRFQGCASGRDRWLQLGSDIKGKWDRFPQAHNWEWVPGGQCRASGSVEDGLRDWDPEQMVRDLVERGGWLLVGGASPQFSFLAMASNIFRFGHGEPLFFSFLPSLSTCHRCARLQARDFRSRLAAESLP